MSRSVIGRQETKYGPARRSQLALSKASNSLTEVLSASLDRRARAVRHDPRRTDPSERVHGRVLHRAGDASRLVCRKVVVEDRKVVLLLGEVHRQDGEQADHDAPKRHGFARSDRLMQMLHGLSQVVHQATHRGVLAAQRVCRPWIAEQPLQCGKEPLLHHLHVRDELSDEERVNLLELRPQRAHGLGIEGLRERHERVDLRHERRVMLVGGL